jgi:hypothetical protein
MHKYISVQRTENSEQSTFWSVLSNMVGRRKIKLALTAEQRTEDRVRFGVY